MQVEGTDECPTSGVGPVPPSGYQSMGRELFFGCEREIKKHCIQFSNLMLTLDLDEDRFGL
jgi:hypothetical protein